MKKLVNKAGRLKVRLWNTKEGEGNSKLFNQRVLPGWERREFTALEKTKGIIENNMQTELFRALKDNEFVTHTLNIEERAKCH